MKSLQYDNYDPNHLIDEHRLKNFIRENRIVGSEVSKDCVLAISADIADGLLEAWEPHHHMLKTRALPYLDCLIDRILAFEPLPVANLLSRLRVLVPGLPLGTARRLVTLKFGYVSDRDIVNAQY